MAALAACALCSQVLSFTSGTAPTLGPRAAGRSVAALAEAAAAPAPAPSAALVKVTEQSTITTAGVLGGVVGLLLGGVWVGGALFTISSYLARQKDDDVAKALKGAASGSLEAINYAAYVNEKYTLTDKLGSAISSAVDSAKSNPETKEAVTTVSGVLNGAGEAIKSFDKEVGIQATLGSILTAGGDLAAQALQKAIDLDKQYKITDQVKEKINEVTAKS